MIGKQHRLFVGAARFHYHGIELMFSRLFLKGRRISRDGYRRFFKGLPELSLYLGIRSQQQNGK
jgi:hypothetical protein